MQFILPPPTPPLLWRRIHIVLALLQGLLLQVFAFDATAFRAFSLITPVHRGGVPVGTIVAKGIFETGPATPSLLLFASSGENGGVETEAEALLRKARAIRAAAEEAEQSLHTSLIEKKARRDVETDALIDELFPRNVGADDGAPTVEELSNRLQRNRPSADMLLRAVERLHEREVAARGLKHVEPSKRGSDGGLEFEVVSLPDDAERIRVEGLIDVLISAADLLDKEFLRRKHEAGGKFVRHANADHWAEGELAKVLRDKAGYLGREHTDQFKKRLEEFYEAAHRKKGRKDVEDAGAKL